MIAEIKRKFMVLVVVMFLVVVESKLSHLRNVYNNSITQWRTVLAWSHYLPAIVLYALLHCRRRAETAMGRRRKTQQRDQL